MKYLIVLALIAGVFWFWRQDRLAEKKAARTPPPRAPSSQGKGITEMVACDVCHVHLPKSEALIAHKGAHQGIYCCDAHRRQAGG